MYLCLERPPTKLLLSVLLGIVCTTFLYSCTYYLYADLCHLHSCFLSTLLHPVVDHRLPSIPPFLP